MSTKAKPKIILKLNNGGRVMARSFAKTFTRVVFNEGGIGLVTVLPEEVRLGMRLLTSIKVDQDNILSSRVGSVVAIKTSKEADHETN